MKKLYSTVSIAKFLESSGSAYVALCCCPTLVSLKAKTKPKRLLVVKTSYMMVCQRKVQRYHIAVFFWGGGAVGTVDKTNNDARWRIQHEKEISRDSIR